MYGRILCTHSYTFREQIMRTSHLYWSVRLSTVIFYKLRTLHARRLCCDLTIVYKILNGFLRVDPTFFFSVSNESRTRGHNYRIKMSHTRLDIRKYWFSNRVIPIWNSLPATCVEAPTVGIFKQELFKHLSSLGVHWFVSFFIFTFLTILRFALASLCF